MSDMLRRLDEAAAFMEQGKAVFVPTLLTEAKGEIARLRGGWLRVIQTENYCRATGLPCAEKCGCLAEQDELAKIEDVALG